MADASLVVARRVALVRRIRIVSGVVVLVGMLAVSRWLARDHLTPAGALAALRAFQHQPWAVPAFLVSYVLLTSALVPAMLFHLVAGAAWGFPLGLALNLAACNAVACLQFWVARRVGRERISGLVARWGLARFDAAAARGGFRAAIALRVLPIPFVAANAAAGVSALRMRDFALGTLVATIPMTTIYTYFSASVVAGVAGAEKRALIQVVAAGALLVIATYGPRLLQRSFTPRRSS